MQRTSSFVISALVTSACASTLQPSACETTPAPAPISVAVDEPSEAEREQAVRVRWIARGDAHDFEWLEWRVHVRLEQDPRDLGHWAELARLHIDRSVRDEDRRALGHVALILADADRVGGESAELELVRGLHAQLEGRHADAVASWQRAIDLDPLLSEARLRLGIACLEHRDFARAAVQLGTYVELVPYDADGWLGLGVAYAHTNERAAARAAYREAAKLAPDDPRPHWNLVLLSQDLAWADDDADLRDEYKRSLDHLDDLFKVVREYPVPDCEPVFFPDPECLAAHEQRLQLVADAAEREAIADDMLHALTWRPPSTPAREMAEALEKAEQERIKQLLEMEKAAAAAGDPVVPDDDAEGDEE